MEAADWIYGVTMEEPGISSIVGVQLDDVVDKAAARLG
jgi:chromosome segregation protein